MDPESWVTVRIHLDPPGPRLRRRAGLDLAQAGEVHAWRSTSSQWVRSGELQDCAGTQLRLESLIGQRWFPAAWARLTSRGSPTRTLDARIGTDVMAALQTQLVLHEGPAGAEGLGHRGSQCIRRVRDLVS